MGGRLEVFAPYQEGAMKPKSFSAVIVLLGASCAGYDGLGLRAGSSNEGAVREVMGAPALEFAAEDGGKDLIYPRGPLGIQTFVAHVDRGGVLEEIRPVLKDETFRRMQLGMTQDQVLRRIGPPGEKMHFGLSDQTAWDYRYVDTWGYTAIFSATFDARGVLVSKFTRRLDKDRGKD
jgi:hypothetical protein